MELNPSYSVQWLSNLEVPLANKFYREHGFRGSAKRHERCAVVRDEHRTIIACGYLRNYSEFTLLAGVAVAPSYQGRGVARLLLQKLSEAFDAQTYTFPYLHLQAFYESLGFQRCESDDETSQVSDLYHRYLSQGREITMMVYELSGNRNEFMHRPQ